VKRRNWLPVMIVAAIGGLLVVQTRVRAWQPQAEEPADSAAESIRLEFGIGGALARQWTGEVSAVHGEILRLSGWHFLHPDRVIATKGFEFETRIYAGEAGAFREPATDLPVPVLPNGVLLTLRTGDGAEVAVHTNHGDFRFRLADLKAAGRLPFLNGDVDAVYTPAPRPLTQGAASQHDFPSIASGAGREVAAWVTYQNEANLVYFAVNDGGGWKVQPASPQWGDYYGSAVAVDGRANAHVVWGEYKDDRWRLAARAYDIKIGKWSDPEYLAPAGRRQMFPRLVTDAAGSVWAAWQEFDGGNFEVFAARRGARGWEAPIRVSTTAANDWQPAIAAAPDGTVWVAWDSYDGGNYDVYLRAIRGGKAQAPVRVTHSPKFEAHTSIAVDARNRVWLAWDESDANWGKDTGVIAKTGTALHTSRRIRLACYRNGELVEPAQPLAESLPRWMQRMNEYPVLAAGNDGLVYVFFRHFLARIPRLEDQTLLKIGDKSQVLQPWYDTVRQQWDIAVTAFDGSRWLPARELPASTGRCYMQSGAAAAKDGMMFVWPVDGRTYENPHVTTAQLRYTLLPSFGRPAEERMQSLTVDEDAVASAAPTEAADLAAIRAARWRTDRLWRGDLHRHTDISADADRDGDILDTYRYAIDAASLDFMAVTDHSGAQRLNYYRYDWWRNRQIATLFQNPGHFVTFFGYERTVTYPGGHRNVISTSRAAQPYRISDEEFSGVESYATRLFPYLKARGDIAIPHTTATGGGTNWNGDDPTVEPVVEIFQGLRGSYEEAKGPSPGVGRAHPDGYVWNAWAKGRRVGVIASSDHNSTHESYACVWAPELTNSAILGALKARRCYAATDNIIVRVEATAAGGKVYRMGEELHASAAPELRLEVRGAAAIQRIELIRNQQILLARDPGAATATLSYRDTAPAKGLNVYHVRMVQQNGQVAWASPIWVNLP
jgi:hypothetical protein